MHERFARGQAWAGAAVAAAVAYVAVDVALVFLRPQLSVLHNAESDYGSKGPYAWLMDANVVLRCLLSLAVVAALARTESMTPRLRTGLACLVVWAVASGLLAAFPDDPVGTKTHGLGKVHLALAGIAFVAVVIVTRVTTRALRLDRAWRPIATLLAALSWGALVPVLLVGRAHLRPHSLRRPLREGLPRRRARLATRRRRVGRAGRQVASVRVRPAHCDRRRAPLASQDG